MQIGAAYRRSGDFDNDIVRMFNFWFRYFFDLELERRLVFHCFH